ncbi:MAG: 30S ribosomal protein S19e [Nanoarchaeota archaeon]|nr:30S ribosomal protein S19e [Nanoarchaeota archaeon]
MATIYDVETNDIIDNVAEKLKKDIEKPEWAQFVKTGTHKERSPIDKDWWYKRSASILRKIYILGPIGINKMRRYYGGKKNRGYKPEKYFIGGGKIIRTIFQQLEKAGYIKLAEIGNHKGRIITAKGKSFMDNAVRLKEK